MAKNPKVIEAFVRGLIDGWTLTYSDYAKSIRLIESYDPAVLKPDLIKFNLDRQKSSILPAGKQYARFDPSQWQSLQQILVEAKLIDELQDLSRAAVLMPHINRHVLT